MYELQSAIVDISNKQYRDKELTDEGLLSELKAAENILKESVKYLLYEPNQSPEGRLAQMALSELKMLRSSIKNIQEDVLVSGDVIENGDGKKTEITKRLKEKLEKNRDKVEKKENSKNNKENKNIQVVVEDKGSSNKQNLEKDLKENLNIKNNKKKNKKNKK